MEAVGLYPVLATSAALFLTGLAGVLSRRNLLIVLMCIELMLNAVNLAFVGFARSVARELGSRSITCNVVAPGPVETDMTAALGEKRLGEDRTWVVTCRDPNGVFIELHEYGPDAEPAERPVRDGPATGCDWANRSADHALPDIEAPTGNDGVR